MEQITNCNSELKIWKQLLAISRCVIGNDYYYLFVEADEAIKPFNRLKPLKMVGFVGITVYLYYKKKK